MKCRESDFADVEIWSFCTQKTPLVTPTVKKYGSVFLDFFRFPSPNSLWSQTNIGAGAHFEGTVLCATAVALLSGASINGHILITLGVTCPFLNLSDQPYATLHLPFEMKSRGQPYFALVLLRLQIPVIHCPEFLCHCILTMHALSRVYVDPFRFAHNFLFQCLWEPASWFFPPTLIDLLLMCGFSRCRQGRGPAAFFLVITNNHRQVVKVFVWSHTPHPARTPPGRDVGAGGVVLLKTIFSPSSNRAVRFPSRWCWFCGTQIIINISVVVPWDRSILNRADHHPASGAIVTNFSYPDSCHHRPVLRLLSPAGSLSAQTNYFLRLFLGCDTPHNRSAPAQL